MQLIRYPWTSQQLFCMHIISDTQSSYLFNQLAICILSLNTVWRWRIHTRPKTLCFGWVMSNLIENVSVGGVMGQQYKIWAFDPSNAPQNRVLSYYRPKPSTFLLPKFIKISNISPDLGILCFLCQNLNGLHSQCHIFCILLSKLHLKLKNYLNHTFISLIPKYFSK